MPFLRCTLQSNAYVSSALKFFATLLVLIAGTYSVAQNAVPSPNSDPTYQALRNVGLSGEAVSVTNFDLKRDAGTFRLHSGTFCFVAPVNGKVTGAVFSGDGVFSPGIKSNGLIEMPELSPSGM